LHFALTTSQRSRGIDLKNLLWASPKSERLFACRVTSKILGIGSAERNWGEVKHLKTDKHSHLSADRVKKQATIFGADCASRARLEREAVQKGKTDVDDAEFFSGIRKILIKSSILMMLKIRRSVKPSVLFDAGLKIGRRP